MRGKVGRPARLDRNMIARAAYEIGLDQVTMKAVADHLGVSVPGLYHHVEGRDDLMRLAAEYSTSLIQIPVDHGQHWAPWLVEWANHNYDAFVDQPELLSQFLNGSIGIERVVTAVDAVVGLLVRHGFTPAEALDAYMLVSQCALGAAVGRIREMEAARVGRPAIAEFHRELAQRPADELPNLRALVSGMPTAPATFVDQVCTVLIGIAVRRGSNAEDVLLHVPDAAVIVPS